MRRLLISSFVVAALALAGCGGPSAVDRGAARLDACEGALAVNNVESDGATGQARLFDASDRSNIRYTITNAAKSGDDALEAAGRDLRTAADDTARHSAIDELRARCDALSADDTTTTVGY